jgi:hypothetical protein
MNNRLYDAITAFADKWGSVRMDVPECKADYDALVSVCIETGKIPECNRKEYSTHGSLRACIVYESDRARWCR